MTGADYDGRLVCLECGGRYRRVGMIARFPVVRLGRRAWSHPASKTHEIARNTRLVCERITAAQFKAILELGEADEGYAVDQA